MPAMSLFHYFIAPVWKHSKNVVMNTNLIKTSMEEENVIIWGQ